MKIYSIEFVDNWSWSLIFNNFHFDIERVFLNQNESINVKQEHDIVFLQNVTLLKKIKERIKVISRMGGNYNFDNAGAGIKTLLDQMSKCYCLIATNKKLYDIGKGTNERTYLIPNGIDLKEWKPKKYKKRNEIFTVGFSGNISNAFFREYKGWDIVKEACEDLNIKLFPALYQDAQIPHNEMKEKFYDNIDCLVHPTKGEGCSNTLMEACACGIPIITTKEAGFHGELMEHEKDVLFCERTVKSIQDCIIKLVVDKNLFSTLKKNSRTFAEQHHDINKVAKQYEEIFKECYKFNIDN